MHGQHTAPAFRRRCGSFRLHHTTAFLCRCVDFATDVVPVHDTEYPAHQHQNDGADYHSRQNGQHHRHLFHPAVAAVVLVLLVILLFLVVLLFLGRPGVLGTQPHLLLISVLPTGLFLDLGHLLL